MVVTMVEPPDEMVALGGLGRVDYAEGFRLVVAADDRSGGRPTTAEGWARAALEGAPWAMRRFMTTGWSLLGIDLGPSGSVEHVHGWRILRAEADVLVQGVHSSRGLGTVRIVVRRRDAGRDDPTGVAQVVDWVMVIEFGGTVGRAIWAVGSPGHRAFVRCLLRLVGR